MWEDFIHRLTTVRHTTGEGFHQGFWKPAVDVYRTPHGWVAKFDLAGVPQEDLSVRVAGSQLTVSGSRRDRLIDRGASQYRMEISYSRFERTIDLPCDIESAKIDTEMTNGMLLVWIQERGEPETRSR